MKEYKCPNCGAPLKPTGPTVTCTYCRSEFYNIDYDKRQKFGKAALPNTEYVVVCGGGGAGAAVYNGGGGGGGCGDGYHPGTRGNANYSQEFIAEVIRLADQGKQVRL